MYLFPHIGSVYLYSTIYLLPPPISFSAVVPLVFTARVFTLPYPAVLLLLLLTILSVAGCVWDLYHLRAGVFGICIIFVLACSMHDFIAT